jgi:NADPH:quinone reductase-like Zn-dependent oxidoreductase
VALTAWEALVGAAKLQAGERVLIEAGAGGVGSVAIQLARHLGATVATTCSPRNEALVRALGADLVVNYQTQRFDEVLEPQDVILEMMGDPSQAMALRALRPGGRLASINGGLEPRVERWGAWLGSAAAGLEMGRAWVMARLRHKVKLFHVVRRPSGADLAQITALVEAGAIKPQVEKVYPLDQIAQAHRDSESGRVRGKIVLDLR